MREEDAAERPGEIADGEDAEGLKLAEPIRDFRREEQTGQDRDEKDENDEIVEFERAAESCQGQRLIFRAAQRPRRAKGDIRHGQRFPFPGDAV
jgi:hypothetical protein